MTIKKKKGFSILPRILLVVLIFVLGGGAGYFYSQKLKPKERVSETQEDIYLAFSQEVWEKISQNYWEKISEENLTDLFVKGIETLTGQPQVLPKNNQANLWQLLKEINQQIKDETKKKEFTVKLADLVLANLKPYERSRLYTQKEEKSLSENVKNISGVDQYQVLEVEKEASQKEIESAYKEKIAQLEPEKDKSPKAKEEYEQVQQAYKVLADRESRQIYDASGVEPTIDYQLIRPEILYLHWKKFSPTTFEELKRVTEKSDQGEILDTLILDLRDNIGGAIDGLPYFLGPFIGQDQYAYQFFHQGEKMDFKTRTGWLPSLARYKKVVILINENTQSSAEVMAAVLKKFNVGILVGTPTKGWGTVEKVFPLENQLDQNEKYSVFLAHSLTLDEAGQPIEGRGIQPLINLESPNWEKQLFAYFHYPELIEAVKEVL